MLCVIEGFTREALSVAVSGQHNATAAPVGCCDSFSSKLRDELLNCEIFYSIAEARPLVEASRINDNAAWPHRLPGYRAPASGATDPRRGSIAPTVSTIATVASRWPTPSGAASGQIH